MLTIFRSFSFAKEEGNDGGCGWLCLRFHSAPTGFTIDGFAKVHSAPIVCKKAALASYVIPTSTCIRFDCAANGVDVSSDVAVGVTRPTSQCSTRINKSVKRAICAARLARHSSRVCTIAITSIWAAQIPQNDSTELANWQRSYFRTSCTPTGVGAAGATCTMDGRTEKS